MVTDAELTLARKIAYQWARKWSLVEYDDLASTLVLWLYEHENVLERYRDDPHGEGKLFVSLRRQASRYCVKEQTDRSGGPLAVDSQWTLDQIRRAMPYVFEAIPQSTYATVTYDGSDGPIEVATNYSGTHSEALAIITDLRGALLEMPDQVRETLILHFRDGMSYAEMGRLTGTTGEACRQRVSRALVRMRDALAGSSDR